MAYDKTEALFAVFRCPRKFQITKGPQINVDGGGWQSYPELHGTPLSCLEMGSLNRDSNWDKVRLI